MDRTTAKILREKLNKIFAEHGIEGFDIDVGNNASYDTTQVTFKVVIKDAGAPTQDEKDLQKYANTYDLDTSKIATVRGDKYSLVGFNTRARKTPFTIQKLGISESNNRYRITTEQAQRFFGKAN
jgi:hypothetical protein